MVEAGLDFELESWYNTHMRNNEPSIPCRSTASFRQPQVQPVKDTPAKRESRILLYKWRAENNLDIFTGKPKVQG
jgi:hypothetical protein